MTTATATDTLAPDATLSPAETEALVRALARARRDLIAFRRIVLANDEAAEASPAAFHQEWSDLLLHGAGHVAIEAFRESAKTQYVVRAFPLYCLLFPDAARSYVAIIKNTSDLAHDKLLEIEAEARANPLIAARIQRVLIESGRVFEVEVLNDAGATVNVRFEAYGKGASIRGLSNLDRRPQVAIIDDPQDVKDAESPTVLANDWKWFVSDVTFLGKFCRIFLIGNNLGERCIIEQVFAHAEELGFATRRVPIADESLTAAAWPARFDAAFVRAEKENYRKVGQLEAWLRERMCLAVADETRVFVRGDFRYYNAARARELASTCNLALLVDPAASVSATSDYRALTVMGCDADDHWFVLDCSFGLYDTGVLLDELFRLVVLWCLETVGIEQGALKAALDPFITKEQKRRQVFFNVVPLENRRQKELRIAALAPRYRAHTIYHPDNADGSTPWVAELEAELLAFTKRGTRGLRDDVIDSAAFFEQVAAKPFGKLSAAAVPSARRVPDASPHADVDWRPAAGARSVGERAIF